MLNNVSKFYFKILEHKKITIDTTEFIKLLIDWSIFETLKTDPLIKDSLPQTSQGEIYFFNPNIILEQHATTAYSFND